MGNFFTILVLSAGILLTNQHPCFAADLSSMPSKTEIMLFWSTQQKHHLEKLHKMAENEVLALVQMAAEQYLVANLKLLAALVTKSGKNINYVPNHINLCTRNLENMGAEVSFGLDTLASGIDAGLKRTLEMSNSNKVMVYKKIYFDLLFNLYMQEFLLASFERYEQATLEYEPVRDSIPHAVRIHRKALRLTLLSKFSEDMNAHKTKVWNDILSLTSGRNKSYPKAYFSHFGAFILEEVSNHEDDKLLYDTYYEELQKLIYFTVNRLDKHGFRKALELDDESDGFVASNGQSDIKRGIQVIVGKAEQKLAQERKRHSQELEAMKKELENVNHKLKDTPQKLEEVKGALAQNKSKLQNEQKEKQNLATKLAGLRSEFAQLKERILQETESKTQALSKVCDLEKELAQVSKIKSELDAVAVALERVSTEKDDLSQQFKTTLDSKGEAEKKAGDLEKELALIKSIAANSEELQKEKVALENQVNHAKGLNLELQKKETNYLKEITDLKAQIASIQNHLLEAQDNLEKSKQEELSLKQQLSSSEQNSHDLTKSVDDKEKRNREIVNNLEDANAALKEQFKRDAGASNQETSAPVQDQRYVLENSKLKEELKVALQKLDEIGFQMSHNFQASQRYLHILTTHNTHLGHKVSMLSNQMSQYKSALNAKEHEVSELSGELRVYKTQAERESKKASALEQKLGQEYALRQNAESALSASPTAPGTKLCVTLPDGKVVFYTLNDVLFFAGQYLARFDAEQLSRGSQSFQAHGQ